jgi:hypothetical protein
MSRPSAGAISTDLPPFFRLRPLAAGLCLLGAVLGWSHAAAAADPTEPGLAVAYTFGDYDNLDPIVERIDSGNPNPGKPIVSLDNRGNEGTKVLTSNFAKLVGAVLTGYVKFPEAGTYQISGRVNDGMRVLIDGQLVLEDKDVAPDRDVGPAAVTVAEAGWHPIKIYFYQRKGSWRLQVMWSGPGLPEMAPIGAEYLAH